VRVSVKPIARTEIVADTANHATLQLLNACAEAAHPHDPRFDVDEIDRGFWVRDHGRSIAFIDRRTLGSKTLAGFMRTRHAPH